MLLVSNATQAKPCGCHGGMGLLRRSRGLGQTYDTSSPPTLAQIKQIAVSHGVDPNSIDQLAASGADIIQLLLVANGTSGAAQEQSVMDTANTDFNTGTSAIVPAPGTPAAPFDLLGFVTEYGGWLAAGVIGLVLVKKFL
jgi:hypothetical protein